MLKANGDLKSQVESMTEALEGEKARARSPAAPSPSHNHAHDHAHDHDHDHAGHDHSHDGHSHEGHSHSHAEPSHSHSASTTTSRGLPSTPSTPTSVLSTPTRSNNTSNTQRHYAHRRVASHLPSVSENVSPAEAAAFPFDSPSDASRFPPGASPLSPPLVPVVKPSSSQPGRHGRKASLSLLKTRMEDELGVQHLEPVVSPGPKALTPTTPAGERRTRSAVLHDGLVWCSCCQGDLFVV